MKRKLLTAILSIVAALCLCFGMAACDDKKQTAEQPDGEVWTMERVYARAQELGFEGTLEELIAQFKGEAGANGLDGKDGQDGKDGVGIKQVYINVNGELIIELTDGTPIYLGTVRGKDGENGKDGVTPHIGENGTWWIGEQDTGIKAQGADGKDGVDGEDGTDGTNGTNGQNGITPHIGENGNWWIGEQDTGVKAAGRDGEDATKCEHVFPDEWDVVTEGSCGSMGCRRRTCEKCSYIEYQFDRPLSHEYGAPEDLVYSCTAHWIMLRCSLCGATYIQKGELRAHQYRNNVCIYCGELKPSDGLEYGSTENGYKVTSIGGCRDSEIVIPNTYMGEDVVAIGDSAFANCANITSVVIPYTVTSIGAQAFSNCKTLKNINIQGDVSSIGTEAFLNCYELDHVKLPDAVTSIGARAFCACYSLTTFDIPNGVRAIEEETFSDCQGLNQITIPDSVTSIGKSAFQSCYNLTHITIPKDMASIERDAFSGCRKLVEIRNESQLDLEAYADHVYTNEEESFLTSTENGFLFYETEEESQLLGYWGEEAVRLLPVQSPNGNRYSIYPYAFYDSDKLVGELLISPMTTTIKEYAFYGCSKLSGKLEIPDGVTTVCEYAFRGCEGIVEISIPKSVNTVLEGAFAFCYSLIDVTWNAINCPVERSMNTPIFCDTNLRVLTIGQDVVKFTPSILERCAVTAILEVEAGNAVYECKQNCIIETSSKTLVAGCKNSVIPGDGSVTVIGNYAFWAPKLTSIVIPNTVTSIGDGAFNGCTELIHITIPDSVTSIGSYAFNGTAFYNDASNWDERVLYIGNHLIEANSISGTYAIRPNTKTIADYAFRNCDRLTSIEIQNSVTSIGIGAFYGCSWLTSIIIPDGVTSIRNQTFYGCSSLTSITIGAGVTSIGSEAFRDCETLEEIHFDGTIDEWKDIEKGQDWDLDTGKYTITCTDGTIDKDGTEHRDGA